MGRVKNLPKDVQYNIFAERILLYRRYINLSPQISMKEISKFIHSK